MFLNKIAIKLIKQYQKKDRPHRCRHIPSCSNYGLECYQKFNFLKASFLTSYRILRCNPLSYKIYDPVPLTKSEKKEQKDYQQLASHIDDELIKLINQTDINTAIIYIWEKNFGQVEKIVIDNYSTKEMKLFFASIERISILAKKKKIPYSKKQSKEILMNYLFSDLSINPRLYFKTQ